MAIRKRILAVAAVDLVLFVLLISFVASPNWWTHWSFRWPVQDPAQITLEVGDVSVELPRPLAIQVVRSILAGPVGLERTVPTDEPPAMLWIAGVEYRWTSPGIGLVADGVLLKYDDPLPPILGELRGAGETPTEERVQAARERLETAVLNAEEGKPGNSELLTTKLILLDWGGDGVVEEIQLSGVQSDQVILSVLRGPEGVERDIAPSGMPDAFLEFPPHSRGQYNFYTSNSPIFHLLNQVATLSFVSPLVPVEF